MRYIPFGAAIILSGLCGSAHADTLLGTINSGPKSIDTGGVFGPVGASLAGDVIAVTFAYSVGSFGQVGNGLYLSRGTGALFIGASINGKGAGISNGDPVATSSIFIGSTNANLDTGAGSARLNNAYLSLATSSTSTITSINALTGPASSGDTIGLNLNEGLFPGGGPVFDTLGFTLTPATTVPEPGSLALLITGLLGLGLVVGLRGPGAGFTPAG